MLPLKRNIRTSKDRPTYPMCLYLQITMTYVMIDKVCQHDRETRDC